MAGAHQPSRQQHLARLANQQGRKPAGQKAAEARAAQVPVPDGLDPASVGVAAARFVYQYRRQHQTGRTWRELAEHLHPNCASTCGPRAERVVPRVHSERIVTALIAAGWLQARPRTPLAHPARRVMSVSSSRPLREHAPEYAPCTRARARNPHTGPSRLTGQPGEPSRRDARRTRARGNRVSRPVRNPARNPPRNPRHLNAA